MAGDGAVAVDIADLPLARLTQFKQELDSQVDLFGTSLQQLKIAQKKYGDSKECVEKMQEMKAGKSLLVPLTDSMYVPGQLEDTKTVLIDIGTGYYVEKELPDAVDYFKRKVKFVTTQIEKVQQIMKEKLVIREAVIETMENKIQATLAQQAAAAAASKS